MHTFRITKHSRSLSKSQATWQAIQLTHTAL